MTPPRDFVLIAGRPALDLCNTQMGDVELLRDPEDLSRWFATAGLTDHPPTVSARELAFAKELRAGLRPVLLTSDGPRMAAIAEEWLGRTPGHLCVEERTLTPRFEPEQQTSCCLLVSAVLDALDIVRETPDRVRECAGPSCPVIYLDTSRNRSRRWCSMEVCGARAKASTYYRRHRGAAG